MSHEEDTASLAIELANRYKNNGLTLIPVDDDYEVEEDANITFFSLYEAQCFIHGYDLCKARSK